jgi:transcription elongation factor GreA
MESSHLMTAEGYEALRKELEHLETVAREQIAQQIKTAREFGDLKENAEYHAAKDAQAHLETKILSLREQFDHAQVVEKSEGDVVGFGSTVEVEDEETGRRTTYTLVSAHAADPKAGRVSYESPFGVALRDKRVGETATVQTPRGGRRLHVLAVS